MADFDLKTDYGAFGRNVLRSDATADAITAKCNAVKPPKHVAVYKNTRGKTRRGAVMMTDAKYEQSEQLLTRAVGELR